MVLYVIFFVAFVLVVVIAVPILGGFGNKPKAKQKYNNAVSLDRGYVQRKWSEIETTANLGAPAHLKASVMDADKLVEYVLSAKVAAGHTFADKLKVSKKLFRNYEDYDNLWYAHKVRNSIAHDNGVDFNLASAKKAIGYFKKALQEMRAL